MTMTLILVACWLLLSLPISVLLCKVLGRPVVVLSGPSGGRVVHRHCVWSQRRCVESGVGMARRGAVRPWATRADPF
jgi:hypothetical protein